MFSSTAAMYAPKTPNAGGGARDVAAARARSVRPASVPAAASRLARRRSASRRASSAMVRVPADRSTTRASRFSISAYARTSRRSDDERLDVGGDSFAERFRATNPASAFETVFEGSFETVFEGSFETVL